MSESISIPKPSIFVYGALFMGLAFLGLLVCLELLLSLSTIIGLFLFYIIFVILAFLCLSTVLSLGINATQQLVFPRTIDIHDGTICLTHSNPIIARWRGFREVYDLSECVWYQGHADWLVLSPYGISILPFLFKKAIIIYHRESKVKIVCGISCSNFDKWCDYLRDKGVYECCRRSFAEPLIVLLLFICGIGIDFLLLPFCMPLPIVLVISSQFLIPGVLAVIGSLLCGNELLWINKNDIFLCVFLYIMLMVVLFAVPV